MRQKECFSQTLDKHPCILAYSTASGSLSAFQIPRPDLIRDRGFSLFRGPVTNFPPIKRLPLADLIPYARNARTHSDAQVAQIAASIKEFGWTNPVLIDGERGIIAGHGRVLAARKLGMEEVPCIELAHLTDAQKRAYILADNQLAANAGWDMELLKIELGDLDEAGFDLSLIGFDEGFLAGLLEDLPEGLTDPDETPEAPEQPVTQPGDVWTLGNHRLMCGDSTSLDAVEKLMDGRLADMIFTDPPYGMSYGGGRAGKVGSTDGTVKKFGVILGDEKTGVDLVSMVRDALANGVAASKTGGLNTFASRGEPILISRPH